LNEFLFYPIHPRNPFSSLLQQGQRVAVSARGMQAAPTLSNTGPAGTGMNGDFQDEWDEEIRR
jgi:hypothetical protein